MTNQCMYEFYFRKKDIEALLKKNRNAEAIIIKHEIKTAKAGRKNHVNLIEVSAYALNSKKAVKTKGLPATEASNDSDGTVYGCPYPPGCPPVDN